MTTSTTGKKLTGLFVCGLAVLILLLKYKNPFVLAKMESSSCLSDDLFAQTTTINNVPKHARHQYEQDGFIVLRNLVSKEAAAALINELNVSGVFDPESNIVRKTFSSVSKTFMTPSLSFQPVADMLYKGGMAPRAKKLIGAKKLYHFFDALYLKSPGTGMGNWHRDYPVTRVVQDLDTMVNVWMPLSKTVGGADGGTMVMAKGSHKWGFEEGCTGLDNMGGELVNKEWKGYNECMDRLEQVSVPLPPMEPGDAVLFHPSIIHRTASSKGLSEGNTRVALSLVAVTDEARFSANQELYQCNIKSRVGWALENNQAADGDLLKDLEGTMFSELIPENSFSGPELIKKHVSNLGSKKLVKFLGTTLLGCAVKRKFGIVPPSYEGTYHHQKKN